MGNNDLIISDEEVIALRGTEIKLIFTKGNGYVLEGVSVDAYISQSDRYKGISIMGILPDDIDHNKYGFTPGEEHVLSCVTAWDEPYDTEFIHGMNIRIQSIMSGIVRTDDNIKNLCGGIDFMNDSCPFS